MCNNNAGISRLSYSVALGLLLLINGKPHADVHKHKHTHTMIGFLTDRHKVAHVRELTEEDISMHVQIITVIKKSNMWKRSD